MRTFKKRNSEILLNFDLHTEYIDMYIGSLVLLNNTSLIKETTK